MHSAEFDRFADAYAAEHARSVKRSGESPAYFARYKVVDLLRDCRAPVRRVLDFGCGVGASIPFLRMAFPTARIVGLDVSQRSLQIAGERFGTQAEFCRFDGATLPFEDGGFDIVLAACVFHHIPAAAHVPLLREIRRCLAPDGRLAVWEHNPLNPLTREAVARCEFDANAVLIPAGTMRARCLEAGFTGAATGYRVFFPRPLRALRPLEPRLGWLPLGAQYRICARA